jgi:hypothetical protein
MFTKLILIIGITFALFGCQAPVKNVSSVDRYQLNVADYLLDKDILKKSFVLYFTTKKLITPILTIYGDKFVLHDVFNGPISDKVHFIPELDYGMTSSHTVNKTKYYNGCYRTYESKEDLPGYFLTSEKMELKALDNAAAKKLNLPYLNQNICRMKLQQVEDGPDYFYCDNEEIPKVFETNIKGLKLYFVILQQSPANNIIVYHPFDDGSGFAEVLNYNGSSEYINMLEKFKGLEETKGPALKDCERTAMAG